MDIGHKVTAARKKAGYKSLYALSKATGVASGQLSEIEAGKHSPSLETLERIFHPIGWEVVVTFRPKKKRS